VIKKRIILNSVLLGLCFLVSIRTAAADSTNATVKPLLVAARATSPSALTASAQELGRTPAIALAAPHRNVGISKFSASDDALSRHVSRFSGPPGPTLTVPGANFLRSPLTPAQLGLLYSESVQVGEGELVYDFPPGTELRKMAATQSFQKN
jgi:hypothetical protein